MDYIFFNQLNSKALQQMNKILHKVKYSVVRSVRSMIRAYILSISQVPGEAAVLVYNTFRELLELLC